jgi:hypothetical protein
VREFHGSRLVPQGLYAERYSLREHIKVGIHKKIIIERKKIYQTFHFDANPDPY